ncbi:MAG TPA: hypothetical protein VKU19_32905 [Bryobacteraceae bacterium]|nr:hypothetical protein [Bryobacteraceae bacterium]
MADSYSVLAANSMESPDEVVPKAEAAARRAVALSPDPAEAHASLGLVFYTQWNWNGADRELKEARRLNPNLSIAYHRVRFWVVARRPIEHGGSNDRFFGGISLHRRVG